MVTVEREEEADKLMGEEVKNGLRPKEPKEARRCSCRAQQGKREEEDGVSNPISNFKSSAHFVDRDGPALNLETMGQDSLGCKLLKAHGLFRVGPRGSESRDKCFKGLGLHSRPYVEEEKQSKGEDGKLKPLRN